MKKIFVIIAALVVSVCVYANTRYMYIVNSDLSEQRFALSTDLKVTFSGNTMLVHDAESTTEFFIPDVKGFYYTSFTSQESIEGDSPVVSLSPSALTIVGLPDGVKVCVYDIAGRCLDSSKAADQRYSLDLYALPAGSYVAVCNGKSIKFLIRK